MKDPGFRMQYKIPNFDTAAGSSMDLSQAEIPAHRIRIATGLHRL
jgi:hypothetical protein